jgi:hypothetical protein
MSRAFSYFAATLCALSLSSLHADEFVPTEEVIIQKEAPAAAAALPTAPLAPAVVPAVPKPVAKAAVPEAPFKPFTGKVTGKKVRIRAHADLESSIIKEVTKNDLISIIGERGDFWAVEPPAGTKAYVFRSFILDNVVEGNKVNVRLKPDLESPVIGHLSAGEKVNGTISNLNNKWLEIAAPSNTRFYIAKDFIENIGGLDVKMKHDKRKAAAFQLLDATSLLSKAELKKPYNEIDIEKFVHNYNTIVKDYADFSDYVTQAKEGLASLQEAYLQKKVAFLEMKTGKNKGAHHELMGEKGLAIDYDSPRHLESVSDRMRLWEPVEEALYLTWAHINGNRNIEEYYGEQKQHAVALTGILEPYQGGIKNKPGDFILRDKDIPVAYIYSTKVNLQELVGKRVTVLGTERPNNNFAFPAFFVLGTE